jgi:hypothetical protein
MRHRPSGGEGEPYQGLSLDRHEASSNCPDVPTLTIGREPGPGPAGEVKKVTGVRNDWPREPSHTLRLAFGSGGGGLRRWPRNTIRHWNRFTKQYAEARGSEMADKVAIFGGGRDDEAHRGQEAQGTGLTLDRSGRHGRGASGARCVAPVILESAINCTLPMLRRHVDGRQGCVAGWTG